MNDIIAGYTTLKKERYMFFLDDFLLTLVPQNENLHDRSVFNETTLDKLMGITTTGHQICFLKLKLSCGAFNSAIRCYIPAYILGKNNLEDVEIADFSAITFRGSTIDRYYNPIRKYDYENSSYNLENGSCVIKLKTFDNTDFPLELVPHLSMTLGVTRPPEPTANHLSLGNLHSYLRLQTDKVWHPENLVSLYLRIYNIFVFFNFRRNITFDEIGLSKRTTNGKLYEIARFHVSCLEKSTTISSYNTISHEDIEDHFKDFYRMNPFDKFMLFIPQNDADAKILNYTSYMETCTTFEGLFDLCHDKDRWKISDADHEEIETRIIGMLHTLYSEYTGNKRKEVEGYINRIKLFDETNLRKQFLTVLRENKEILQAVFPRYKFGSDFLSGLAYKFVDQRNSLTHGRTEILSSMEVTPCSIAICLIYIMMLQIVDIDQKYIIKIIRKLFGNYR